MKKTIRNFDLSGKKVIIRCDFNVPIKNGVITDDNRIRESLETINYALNHNAKVILMSHLGRIKAIEDLNENTLCPVAVRLEELLQKKVIFVRETRGKELEEKINNLKDTEVLLMENTRFEDLDGEKESKNDEELGKYWASLGDIYINDAFGTSHRSHASNVGIATHLPNGIGFLIEKELLEFVKIKNPKRPLTIIMGGSKVKDKINLIKNLASMADYLLLGGGIAFTFLHASGINIGKSILDEESLDFCREMLAKHKDKIILPVDAVCSYDTLNEKSYSKDIKDFDSLDIGLDIGEKTSKIFEKIIKKSNTVLWNGPVGMSEYEQFSNGTKAICEALKEGLAIKIVGGGDTAAAVINFGYKKYMTHISTGGGAFLELIEGKSLPGIEIIDEK